ncbi:MAG: hypothetical protein V3U92_01385 [Cellulophaga sp.]
MEKTITIKNEYNSLDTLHNFLKTASSFETSKDYDNWEHRTDANGQMAQCIVLKKSSMHAIKLFFTDENKVKINHVIPSKVMHAYFGKSVKARRSILQIIIGNIMEVVLAPAQKKAFEELENIVRKAAV